jgi:hypothetical protein
MKNTRRGKIISGLLMAILLAWVEGAAGQSLTYFTGKITEISRGTALGLMQHGNFFIIRLDSKPKLEFRITQEDAVKYGLIRAAGSSEVLTPGQVKGLGWQVKLAVTKESAGIGTSTVYQVKSVERIND